MLSRTIDQTMAKAMKFENMTRKIKFGRSYYTNIDPQKKPDMVEKLAPYIKSAQSVEKDSSDEVLNFIVEDPNNIAPIFDFNKCESTGLPFFRALGQKLNIAQIMEES